MSRAVLVLVPPTVGHVNHGVALANLIGRTGRTPVLVTGTATREHVDWLAPGFPVHQLPSHDLNTDRNDPARRPHLEQLCDPIAVTAAARDQLAVAAEHDAAAVIVKDYFAGVLTAARLDVPCLGYWTDGIESLVPGMSRQTVEGAEHLTEQVRLAATRLGVAAPSRPVPDLLRSDRLNIVRGFPETAAVPPSDWSGLAETVAFTGALTHDGPAEQIDDWRQRLATLARPLTYVTFGTVLKDHRRLFTVAQAAATLPGTVLIATDRVELLSGQVPENVELLRYVPNAAAFAVADVVVHHGGHGTMLSALTAGVPQLVIPDNERTNQAHHGAALRDLGVGLLLDGTEHGTDRYAEPGAEPDAAGLAAAIRRAAGPDLRDRARELAGQLHHRTGELQDALVERLCRI